ncbi:disease resistance protein Roq1-like isoform X2 [Apium graveolens]|uniref:disease resistance protein Roq1-like isoform X2 n=1 Tax=Apium graveolens TaxID=4045 RepID=UPI003D7B658E
MAASTSTNQYGLSSSSSNRHWNVFLSFRGKDTRKTFTSHLFTALEQAGIKTFMDDYGLPRGEEISQQLLKAIQGSEISLIIFSANYASSPWCLNELVEILECKKRTGQIVYPVFHNVSPSVLRHKTGSFAAAFQKHEEKYASNLDKVDKWKAALTEAANLLGYDLQNDADGYEIRLIQIIVNKVLLEVNRVGLNVAKEPVGIESRVAELTQLMRTGSHDIRKIGIYGMGGIGKTTIAKALYNKNFRHFEGSCFLANVRETSERHDGIPHLQEQLLSEILIVDKIRVENEDRGISLLMERLLSKKVLIVLDDLNDRRQFDYLAGQWNQFSVGSRIIVTTRDAGILEQIEVDERYNVEELDGDESLELFSRHAFRKSIPSKDYLELSEVIVRQAGGLPLALEDVFLDIACCFIGNDKDTTISILNSCGFDSENDIDILSKRCLLSVNDKNELRMHDLLQEMGRDIARNNYPNEPWKHSRLWSSEDICNVLHKSQEKKCIECIIPYGGVIEEAHLQTVKSTWVLVGSNPFRLVLDFLLQPSGMGLGLGFQTNAFRDMNTLRLLSINKMHLSGSFEGIFEELRWLSWHNCPLQCLPTDFCPKNLVFLDLQRSNFEKLWIGPRSMKQLKILNISGSTSLSTTPNFSNVPCIEDLNLSGCESLVEVDQSIRYLDRLLKLNLQGCKKLKFLPSGICDLKALEHLDLDCCSILEELPHRLGNMESLSMLRVGKTLIATVPISIGCLSKLVVLKLNKCKNLKFLPSTICNLRKLEHLILYGCSYLEELPCELGEMKSLSLLSIEFTAITSLPESIGHLCEFSELFLHSCKKLRSLPSSICNLTAIKCLDLNHCSNLKELPANIGNIKSLRMLRAEGTAIKVLPESIEHLSELVELVLVNCKSLRYLPSSICNLRSLERLDLSDCSSLEELPEDIGNIKSLREIRACTTKLSEIPNSIGYLKNLEILVLPSQAVKVVLDLSSTSGNTGFIPASVWCLCSLKNLNLSNCYLVDLPDSVSCLSSLQHLNLSGNYFSTLTPSLCQLTNLESLTVTECKNLSVINELPPKLSDLYASDCTSLETLNVSKLNQLRCLYLSCCSSLIKIYGLEKLKSITRIDMAGCENLSITLEESLFQALSANEEKIDMCLPMRDIPSWFTHQRSNSSKISLNVPQTVPHRFLGMILWFNIGQKPINENPISDLSDIWASVRVERMTHTGGWFCELSALEPVPQSWVTFIPHAQFPLKAGEEMEVHVKDELTFKSFGGHLMYEGPVEEGEQDDCPAEQPHNTRPNYSMIFKRWSYILKGALNLFVAVLVLMICIYVGLHVSKVLTRSRDVKEEPKIFNLAERGSVSFTRSGTVEQLNEDLDNVLWKDPGQEQGLEQTCNTRRRSIKRLRSIKINVQFLNLVQLNKVFDEWYGTGGQKDEIHEKLNEFLNEVQQRIRVLQDNNLELSYAELYQAHFPVPKVPDGHYAVPSLFYVLSPSLFYFLSVIHFESRALLHQLTQARCLRTPRQELYEDLHSQEQHSREHFTEQHFPEHFTGNVVLLNKVLNEVLHKCYSKCYSTEGQQDEILADQNHPFLLQGDRQKTIMFSNDEKLNEERLLNDVLHDPGQTHNNWPSSNKIYVQFVNVVQMNKLNKVLNKVLHKWYRRRRFLQDKNHPFLLQGDHHIAILFPNDEKLKKVLNEVIQKWHSLAGPEQPPNLYGRPSWQQDLCVTHIAYLGVDLDSEYIPHN